MRRLDQLLANLGYGSRRDAREIVEHGRVTVKGRVVKDFGAKAHAHDVLVDGEALDHPEELLILMHKPVGLVCSHEEREGPSVYTLLPERWRRRNPLITTIGRLDKETSGLLLLTDQAPLVHRLTSPKHKVEKRYVAEVEGELKPEMVEVFASGALLLHGEDEPCLPASLRILNSTTAEVVLTEGRYHQVRRMLASQGCPVKTLHRSHFGEWSLGELKAGEWKLV